MQGARQVGGVGHWLLAQRGQLFPWVPVAMGCGIGLWLGWPGEPGWLVVVVAFALALLGLALWCAPVALAQPFGAAVLAAAVGFLAMATRADLVAAPVLAARYYGPVEGRVIAIDRAASDRMRLTLDRVVLARRAPEHTPAQIRITLHGADGDPLPPIGLRVMTTAHLAPPEGAVEPGGFHYPRLAWFRGLGAVGYTRVPVLAQAPAGRWDAVVVALRMRLSAAIQTAIPGEPGAFAAAMMTGDRSGMGQAAVVALRDSSLYHLVSISGVHMGLLAGFVFVALRSGLALVPPLALRLPVKKIAAVVALLAGAFYLVLSGGDVATERSFVMVAVMLGAVLLDRRAISMRSVAIAAVVLLLLRPETLAEPGFQMSFAATAALVAGFAVTAGWRLPGWARAVAMLVLSSVLAGFASAPFAAAHFNRFTDYGLLANVVASPLMGLLVMPAGVMAAVLAPVGLGAPAYALLGLGTGWILQVAEWVAGLSGAVTLIAAPAPWVLPVLGLAGPALVLLPGRARLAGLAGLALALAGWQGPGRPDLLVSAEGALLGLSGPAGRALSAPRGAGFAARAWLEADGDAADQPQAAARPGFSGPPGARAFHLAGLPARHLSGKGAADRLTAACAEARLVILAAELTAAAPAGCLVIDQRLLAATGPLAIRVTGAGRLQVSTRNATRPRRWDAVPAPIAAGADATLLAALRRGGLIVQ